MILIDGKKTAAELREELKKEVSDLKAKTNKIPGLTVVLIGDMAPSQIYVRMKEKAANEIGLKSEVIRYPEAVEETTVLNIPCITLRENTERPETVFEGTNELVGNDFKKIKIALYKVLSGNWKNGTTPYLWDGKTSERIVTHLIELSK